MTKREPLDLYSRRRNALSAAIIVEGEQFQVGVSRVVLARLLTELSGPVATDATNKRSRYVFKSLGFVRQDGCSNPCMLRFSLCN